jgi:hypothetical protein
VAAALRLRQFDVVSAHEVHYQGLTDEQQLVYASGEGRAIFSFNAADFIQLHKEWMRHGKSHAGIIVADQIPPGETIRRLLALLNRITADEIRNQLRWLQASNLPF